MIYEQKTLNCAGKIVDLSTPVVMGILNITPDSFYAGSRIASLDMARQQAEKMLQEGAVFLDIGGMSSRPGAKIIDTAEEVARIVPVIEMLTKYFPEAIISVDTIHAVVAEAAAGVGARMINDISGGEYDPKMIETVAKLRLPYVLMHSRGTPETMAGMTNYEDMTLEILNFFIKKIAILRGGGVTDIVIDAGFGFAKTVEQNFELLKKMHVFKTLEVPILAGLSRKSMIWRTLGCTAEEAANGTTALNVLALQQGAKILRVHDVKFAAETITLINKYLNA